MQNLLFHKHDIIVLTETHAKKDTSFEDLPLFTYFNFHRKFAHKKSYWPSGGICIFVRDAINYGITIYSTDECIVWIKICSIFFKLERDIYIACVYFTPENSSYLTGTDINTNYFHILGDQIAKHIGQGDLLICDDHNARMGQKLDFVDNIDGTDRSLAPLFQDMHNEQCKFPRYSKDHREK